MFQKPGGRQAICVPGDRAWSPWCALSTSGETTVLIDRATGSLLRSLSCLSLAMWFGLSVRQTRQLGQHRCMEHPPSPTPSDDDWRLEARKKKPTILPVFLLGPYYCKAFVSPDEASTWSSHRGSREPRSSGPFQGRRLHSPPLLTPRIRFSGTPLVQEEPL